MSIGIDCDIFGFGMFSVVLAGIGFYAHCGTSGFGGYFTFVPCVCFGIDCDCNSFGLSFCPIVYKFCGINSFAFCGAGCIGGFNFYIVGSVYFFFAAGFNGVAVQEELSAAQLYSVAPQVCPRGSPLAKVLFSSLEDSPQTEQLL